MTSRRHLLQKRWATARLLAANIADGFPASSSTTLEATARLLAIDPANDFPKSSPQIALSQRPCPHRRRPRLAAPGTAGTRPIELDAAELLAKYTHYCQVCGKGIKRDANLRMHMRAHGDAYKSSAALANPAKAAGRDAASASTMSRRRPASSRTTRARTRAAGGTGSTPSSSRSSR